MNTIFQDHFHLEIIMNMDTRVQPFASYVQHNFNSNFGLNFKNDDAEKLWVGKQLGSGAQGDVYFGTYDPPQLIALKFVKKSPDDEKKLQTFLEISLKLNHPNITRLLAYSMDDEFVGRFGKLGYALFVYSLHKCKSLRDRLNEKGRLSEDNVRKFITDVLEGLVYMHGRGISHNDLKPENIMIDCSELGKDEKAVIIDLGGACFFETVKIHHLLHHMLLQKALEDHLLWALHQIYGRWE